MVLLELLYGLIPELNIHPVPQFSAGTTCRAEDFLHTLTAISELYRDLCLDRLELRTRFGYLVDMVLHFLTIVLNRELLHVLVAPSPKKQCETAVRSKPFFRNILGVQFSLSHFRIRGHFRNYRFPFSLSQSTRLLPQEKPIHHCFV